MDAFPYPERVHWAGFWPVNIKMQNNILYLTVTINLITLTLIIRGK